MLKIKKDSLVDLKIQFPCVSVDSFTPVKVLGFGSQGVVLLCNLNQATSKATLPRQFAVKIFCNSLSVTSQRSFVEKIIFMLDKHMNIIEIPWLFNGFPSKSMVDLFPQHYQEVFSKTIKSSFFMVMEAHHSFKEFLNQNLSPNQKVWLCAEISNALLFLWENRIVHRDMKLENILISSDGFPVISDFGFADFVDPNGVIEFPKILGGNISHLAPEILKSNVGFPINYTKQPSFEIGVISFEITQNIHPFPEYGTIHHFLEKPPNFKNSGLEYVDQFVTLILSLLVNDPNNRKGIAELTQMLQQIV